MTTEPGRALDDLIGNYRLIEELGHGGMGVVWLAEHVMLGQRVAIKFLLATVSQREDIVQRFFDEARAAARIADPGIVAIHDVGWANASAYIVMEQLVGETLATRLSRLHRLPLLQALRFVYQIASTMSVAHERGIIHRDLKPENVFVVSDPAAVGGERVKVLDFGIAKLLGTEASPSRTSSGVIMGTPLYMSPEQCRSAGTVDHRTDIYALGCLLFHLVCGRPPFIGEGAGDLIASHILEEPPAPSELVGTIPPAVDAIAARCLAKAPAERYATMAELAEALAEQIGLAPPPAPRTSRPQIALAPTLPASSPKLAVANVTVATGEHAVPARPKRTRLVVIAGIVLLLAGGAAAAIWAKRPGARAVLPDAAIVDAALADTTPRDPPALASDAGPLDAQMPPPDSRVRPSHPPATRPPRGSAGSDADYDHR